MYISTGTGEEFDLTSDIEKDWKKKPAKEIEWRKRNLTNAEKRNLKKMNKYRKGKLLFRKNKS